jgi:hypothetical protein
VLNHLTESQLPSGKKVSTKGLSFKHVSVEGTKFIVLDSEGSYAPVKVRRTTSLRVFMPHHGMALPPAPGAHSSGGMGCRLGGRDRAFVALRWRTTCRWSKRR